MDRAGHHAGEHDAAGGTALPAVHHVQGRRLYNTKLAIIIIFTIIQSAYGTYLLSSVYGTFPQAILEAASIDGASRWQVLLKVVLPISWPTISVLFVFFFVWTWNEYMIRWRS